MAKFDILKIFNVCDPTYVTGWITHVKNLQIFEFLWIFAVWTNLNL